MGLFSFIKDAGAKVFGYKTSAEEAEEAAKTAATKIEETIKNLGLDVENLNISITGDVATVTGKTHNTSTKEKVVLVVGNSAGIATVDERMEVELKEAEATFHTVVRGDTLSRIAKTVYGDAMKYPVIFEANKPMLKHPDKIYPGQVLRIPSINK